jgi:hypothetical protein
VTTLFVNAFAIVASPLTENLLSLVLFGGINRAEALTRTASSIICFVVLSNSCVNEFSTVIPVNTRVILHFLRVKLQTL